MGSKEIRMSYLGQGMRRRRLNADTEGVREESDGTERVLALELLRSSRAPGGLCPLDALR